MSVLYRIGTLANIHSYSFRRTCNNVLYAHAHIVYWDIIRRDILKLVIFQSVPVGSREICVYKNSRPKNL